MEIKQTKYYNDMFQTYRKERRLSWAKIKSLASGRLTVDVGGMACAAIGLLLTFVI